MMLIYSTALFFLFLGVIVQGQVDFAEDNVEPAFAEVETIDPVVSATLKYDTATCREKSLAKSTWPSDHGDSSRAKYTIGAGLPKGDLNPDDLKIIEQNGLLGPQWLYTYGDNNEYVFAMGGTILSTYVAKMDSKTLEIVQKVMLKPAMYIGGLLMHANGHVYGVQGNTLTVFWNGDLTNSTVLDIPTKLNGNAVQTNGMVVSSDGYLVIKQWPFILEDVALYLYVLPEFGVGAAIFTLLCGLIFVYFIPRKSKNVFSITAALMFGGVVGVALAVGAFILLQWKLFGTYDPVTFVGSNLFFPNAGGGGELKLIDPITLEVVADLTLVERCSFARMALTGEVNEQKEDAIVLVGDEFIRQYRWNPIEKRLYEVEGWAERYRSRNTGTFPGTGPAIHNGVSYFTDNTYPVMLFNHSYNLFSKPVGTYSNEVVPAMKHVPINKPGMAGFMFWSVVVSPVEGDVVVWDSAGQSVQARRADTLDLHWNLSLRQSDCITMAADKGHVYMTHYSGGPQDYLGFMSAIGPNGKKLYPGIEKYFVAVDAATGKTLLNVTIMSDEGMRPALIVPGANNDVLVAKPNGLNRMYF